jgi:hypothetical protein
MGDLPTASKIEPMFISVPDAPAPVNFKDGWHSSSLFPRLARNRPHISAHAHATDARHLGLWPSARLHDHTGALLHFGSSAICWNFKPDAKHIRGRDTLFGVADLVAADPIDGRIFIGVAHFSELHSVRFISRGAFGDIL